MTPEIEQDYLWIRKQIICAIASDQQVGLILALKGGNALAIIHEIGQRTSLDLDYSITTPSAEEESLNAFLHQAITTHFARHSLHVIDWKFLKRPSKPSPNRPASWGGFMAEFKLVRAEDWQTNQSNPEALRRRALGIAPGGGASRKFKLDLSCNEWTEETAIVKLDDVDVLVYSLPLLAAEKLRALCQQMEDYPFSNRPKARPRDFFDLHALVTDGGVNFKSREFHRIVQNVFAAKKVELKLVSQIPNHVDFHFLGWDAVVGSIPPHASRDFHLYTCFVERELEKLKPLWSE